MEDVVQRVFAILISVIIFFLFPLYIAFEKKDDISYALALKITSNFVDNVTSKGYITTSMYDKFISDLSITGNIYDVKIEHRAKKYNPVIQEYGSDFKRIGTSGDLDYFIYKDRLEDLDKDEDLDIDKSTGDKYIKGNSNNISYKDKRYQVGYKENEEIYNWEQISKILENSETSMSSEEYKENYNSSEYGSYIVIKTLIDSDLTEDNNQIYPMSEGDEFNVIIKNTNTTIASVLFNALTLGANAENDTKVYINYGGTIQNEEYRVK